MILNIYLQFGFQNIVSPDRLPMLIDNLLDLIVIILINSRASQSTQWPHLWPDIDPNRIPK